MAKQLQVKLKATNSSDPVHVAGIGSLVAGEWTDVSDKQADKFKAITGQTVKQSSLFETQTIDVKDPEPEPEKEEDK